MTGKEKEVEQVHSRTWRGAGEQAPILSSSERAGSWKEPAFQGDV